MKGSSLRSDESKWRQARNLGKELELCMAGQGICRDPPKRYGTGLPKDGPTGLASLGRTGKEGSGMREKNGPRKKTELAEGL